MPLQPVPASAASARRFAALTLTEWGCFELVDLVVLLVSELVTNAVLHARTGIELAISPTGDGVHVEVRDGSRAVPVARHYEDEAMTGRGLSLVADLAAKWGVAERADGKAVWFDVVPARQLT